MTTKANTLEMSHDRARQTVRLDAVTPLAAPESPATHADGDPATIGTGAGNRGRPFAKGNQAWKLAQVQRHAEGIATMDASKAPTWLRPHVELGRPYVTALLALLDGKPQLYPLAGDVADAHVLYRAHVALATAAETAKDRAALMADARAWLREHRTALATLAALAGDLKLPDPALPDWLTPKETT